MKNLFTFATAFAAGAVLSSGLHAAPVKTAAPKQDCPINVASDKFTADLNAKTGTYTGNVVVVQCDTKLRADTVRISTLNDQADKVNASGNVVVDSPKSGTATGQTGVYDVPKKMVTLNGNVVLKKGKDVMRGAQLTVNLATGQANLGGGVKGQGAPQGGGRVQAVFNPKSGDQ
ncbi:MAG TPA: lipopolysaccharide transport periplasmic protein LptA [Rhizomicrobium sp.]|jgi:lipopolysaccharide export system protein LptA